jgi:hypothetical protein
MMAITNGYCTLAQVKSALKINDTVDDAMLEVAVEAASREIDGFTGRIFYSAGTSSRFFTPQAGDFCAIDDAISISQVATVGSTFGIYDSVWNNPTSGNNDGDYQTEPLNNSYPTDGVSQPITGIRAIYQNYFPQIGNTATVKVTGSWGWSAVPTAIKQATILQASRIFKRNDSPLGVAGFGDFGAIRVSGSIDADVRQLIEPYRLLRNLG